MASMAQIQSKMANLKEDDELNNCSLCLKSFRNPKILPCFHSFCLDCLETYTEVNAHNKKFACPLCGVECIIPPGGLADLQTNFYIQAAKMKLNVAANSVCEVCEDSPRAERSCLECEQNLCQPCCRSHLKMNASRDHHLVSLKDKSHAGESHVTSKAFCDRHRAEELSFYCRKCVIPICLRCKVTSHEQHETEDLSDVASEVRVLLNDMLKEAKKVLPNFHTHLTDITTYGDQLEDERKTLRDEINLQTKKLHEAIDRLAKQTLDDLEDENKVEMARLDTRRKMISDKTSVISMQLHSANQVINFGSDADIARNKDSLAEQLRAMGRIPVPRGIMRLRMDFMASESTEKHEDIENVFGKLKKIRDQNEMLQMEEYAAFSVDTSFKAISSVCPVDDGTAWIALGWTADAHTFYRHGIKIKTHVVSKTIDFIARDGDNNMYMSSNEQKMVGRPGPGFNLDQFATFPGYHPRGMTITAQGDILICLAQSAAFQDYRPAHKNKVVRLDGTGKMISEYGADGKLFLYPLRVAVNVNGDICVSDSKKLAVVIVKPNGELKAEYTGGSESAELRSHFEPRGIACGPRGHIHVADSTNHAVHMLDHLGNLQRLILTEVDGLYGPYSIAIDKEDYMWVGCRDAAVKVYKMVWS